MKSQEERFRTDLHKRWCASLQFYGDSLTSFTSILCERCPSLGPGTQLLHGVDDVWKRFDLERYQFSSMLPTYASKREVIQALRQHAVVIVMSSTGSGKSTQLPQYLLDNVLEPGDQRAIAYWNRGASTPSLWPSACQSNVTNQWAIRSASQSVAAAHRHLRTRASNS
jgi:hypothetical protein